MTVFEWDDFIFSIIIAVALVVAVLAVVASISIGIVKLVWIGLAKLIGAFL